MPTIQTARGGAPDRSRIVLGSFSWIAAQDSLYSIVQMPRGVPVATVAIGNATNGGLLAARIVGASRPALRAKIRAMQEAARAEVEAKSDALLSGGHAAYLASMQSKSTTVM